MSSIASLRHTERLVQLIARAEEASARLVAAPTDGRDRLAAIARREQARASARLDASPLTEATADEVDAGGAVARTKSEESGAREPRGSWSRALRLEGMPTQDIAAIEYANLLAVWDQESVLVQRFARDPLDVLAEIHGRLTDGLVDPAVVGRPRTSEQDVHDGAHGQVVYRGAPVAELADRLAALGHWLRAGADDEPALVVAGVVHERLLEWQPFEAANGRVARVAARLVRRRLDTAGLAVPELDWVADPLAYAREVAATIRRRGDLTRWVEWDAEVTVRALEHAADTAQGRPPPAPPARAVDALAALGEVITVVEYAEAAGVDRATARADLAQLERARLVRPERGTAGLRVRRTRSPDPSADPV
ncbi:hypothetical protein ER308_04750 [Egibacter rhizosphaerae]|uniref:Fido domain-containing protein n=1 Tax=Egibacter rhizosphaerae TaxID=1670831 RepID=A0A411YCJ0_9ACTN|nr:Fic family protein [Egibacter rhizosphaerae]QBI18919.1 hypothetical protein ER308_04750 [Egibacter rhizosphaerae]